LSVSSRFDIIAVVLWLGGSTVVGIKANVEASATASFEGQTSVTVKSRMEVYMVTAKKLIAGLLVGSMLLWGLVTPYRDGAGSEMETLAD